MKASDLLVKALENEGVEYVYAVPGEENLDVVESLRTSSIKMILTRHEQGAAFMAATYGRLTGKAGVCMATLGPGATNFATPAAYAQLGAFPLIMITGQKPIKKSKQGQFQIVDIVKLYEPVCKLSKQIVHGNTIPALVREAFRRAEEERPGAILLELPEDIAAEETDAHLLKASQRRYASADEVLLEDAAELIKQAKSPLLLIGAAANRQSTCDALKNVASKHGLYVFNTQMGKGVIDERCDYFIGTAALSDNDYLHCAIECADLVINIGHDVVEKPPFFMTENGKKVIHVNYKSAQVDEVYFPQLELVGDIGRSVEMLSEKLFGWRCEPMPYFKRIKEEIQAHITLGAENANFPMSPQRVVSETRKVMGENGIVALDNGTYKIWFARNYPAYHPNTVLLDNALATMGAGLPSAMMAAQLKPEKRVLAICGDGGFMMNSQEIETALRMKLNLVVMILNDSAYGMIRWKQEIAEFDDWGLEFNNPDFVKYAQAYGAKGHRITSSESFIEIFDNAFNEGGVHIIDVPIDYAENKSILIDELANKVCLL